MISCQVKGVERLKREWGGEGEDKRKKRPFIAIWKRAQLLRRAPCDAQIIANGRFEIGIDGSCHLPQEEAKVTDRRSGEE